MRAGGLSARLAFRRSFCSLRSLCRRRVLRAVGRKPPRRFGDLLIGQNDWIAEREREIILLRDRLEFDREPHGFIQVGAERDHAVIGEEAAISPLERMKHKVRQFFRSVTRVASASDRGPTESGHHIVASWYFLTGYR